jgi:DNA-binding transcriptional LysR family regulator
VHAAFALLGDAERDMQGAGGQLTGQVRLSVPTSYGHYRLPPLLARFAELHPQVQVEVNITNRNVDLVAEGFDLAIRMGQFPDSGLVVRKLEDATLCLVASPAYLARRGAPSSLAELQAHDCLSFVMPRTGRVAAWSLREEGADIEWTPPGRFQISDDVLGTASLAAAGMGIAQTYDFIAAERIRAGALVEVLPSLRGRTRPFSVVYAPHRRQSAAARSVIEVLTGSDAPR